MVKEFLKNALGLPDIPTRLTSIDGEIIPLDSNFLVPNETYTLNDNRLDEKDEGEGLYLSKVYYT